MDANRATRWKAFDRKRWQFERTATRRFRRALLETIKPILTAPSATEALQIADTLTDGHIIEAYRATYGQVGAYFAVQTQSEIKHHGGVFEQKNDATVFDRFMRDWIATEGAERIVQVSNTTIRRVKVKLQEGINAGLGIEQIARDMVRSGSGIADLNRARVIARTEIISASNKGSIEGAKATGIPLKKEWLATADTRTRDAHIQADGQTVLMDSDFIVEGEPLEYPGDVNGSAGNVINCRCTQVYQPMGNGQISDVSESLQSTDIGDDGLPKTRDIGELDKLIKGINPNIETKIPKTANPDIVREHYKAINWFDKNMGGIKTKFNYEYSFKKASSKGGQFGYFDPNPVNSAGIRSASGDFIPQNIKMISFKDKESFKDILNHTEKTGWWAKGTTVESIMAHEMAHYVDVIGGLKRAGFVGTNSGGRSILLRDNRAIIPNSFQRMGYQPYIKSYRSSNEIMNEMYKSFGINSDLQNDPALAGQIRSQMAKLRNSQISEIGRYASENPAEYIAMAVQYEYMYPGKNKVAEKITQLLFKRYREGFL